MNTRELFVYDGQKLHHRISVDLQYWAIGFSFGKTWFSIEVGPIEFEFSFFK